MQSKHLYFDGLYTLPGIETQPYLPDLNSKPYRKLVLGEGRNALYESIKEACVDAAGPDSHVLEQHELVDFIMGHTARFTWTSKLLPRERTFVENTMFASHTIIPQ